MTTTPENIINSYELHKENSLPPNISHITETEFNQHNLHELRRLVYAIYTKDSQPINVPVFQGLPEQKPENTYLLYHLNGEKPQKPTPKNLLPHQDTLNHFNHIGGFFSIETANLPHQLPEAGHLFEWPEWQQHKNISYLSEFTAHPNAESGQKLNILQTLFRAYNKVNQSDQTLIVLADKIKEFVLQTNLVSLTPTHAPIAENQYVNQLREMFPKYWNTNPKLYILHFII